MQVPIKRTPISMSDYAAAVITAWQDAFGELPTKAAAGVLWAQYMVETGGTACWNFNIGNVKVSQSQVDAGVPWIDLPGTWEVINGKRVVLPEGDPGRRFRAFASLAEAMTEHLKFLRNKRYAVAWPSVLAGDCDGFARTLSRQRYFTASAEDYARGMLAHHKRWMAAPAFDALIIEATPTVTELPSVETLPGIDGGIVHAPIEFPPQVLPDDESGPIEPDGLWTRLAKGLRLRR